MQFETLSPRVLGAANGTSRSTTDQGAGVEVVMGIGIASGWLVTRFLYAVWLVLFMRFGTP